MLELGIELDIKAAHKTVREQRAAGNDVEWDGWDIVFYRPAVNAVNSKDGIWRKGQWAFANRVKVNSEGIWSVDPRNIRAIRGSRPRYRRPTLD